MASLVDADFNRMGARVKVEMIPNSALIDREQSPGRYPHGYIRHPDHETDYLHEWHRVFMNTETKAAAMEHVAFLD
jgi:hypothetical protein